MVTPYFWLTMVIFLANILILALAYKSNNKARFALYLGFLVSYYYLTESFMSFFFDALIDTGSYVLVSAVVTLVLLIWNAISLVTLIEMRHYQRTKKFSENSFIFILVVNIFAILVAMVVYLDKVIENTNNFGIWT